MKRVISIAVLLCMGWCYGQEDEKCISNFGELETALLNSSENQYQIANGYFPSKREINPVCVVSYYYIGVNSSNITKEDCASDKLSAGEDGAVTGCLKWKWCIDSFYAKLNLSQLEDFSLYILPNEATEVEIELPALCNIHISESVSYQYFLRTTLLLYHYARDMSQLGRGTEIIGYAAMFHNSDLEKLTYTLSALNSIDAFIHNKRYSIDLFKLYSTLLFISLLALPLFTVTIIVTAYVDFSTEEDNESASSHSEDSSRISEDSSKISEDSSKDLKFMMYSFLVMCVLAIPAMMYFQIIAFTKGCEWFYLAPYVCLWFFSILNIPFSVFIVHKTDQYLDNDSYKNKKLCSKLSYTSLLKGLVLWMFTTTMQLMSWHLVFVFCGFILNPLRALLYSTAIAIAIVFCVVFLGTIIKVTWTFVEICGCKDKCKAAWCSSRKKDIVIEEEKDDKINEDGKKDRDEKFKFFFLFIDILRMVPLLMLLIYAFAYCVLILHINISSSHQVTIDQLTKLIIPKVFLMIIAWLMYNMFMHPKRVWRYWLLPLMYLDPKEMCKKEDKSK